MATPIRAVSAARVPVRICGYRAGFATTSPTARLRRQHRRHRQGGRWRDRGDAPKRHRVVAPATPPLHRSVWPAGRPAKAPPPARFPTRPGLCATAEVAGQATLKTALCDLQALPRGSDVTFGDLLPQLARAQHGIIAARVRPATIPEPRADACTAASRSSSAASSARRVPPKISSSHEASNPNV